MALSLKHILAAVGVGAMIALVACHRPAPFESAASLVDQPDRLKELRDQCRADWSRLGDAQCNAVAEATRRRFLGYGKTVRPPAAPAPSGVVVPVVPVLPVAPVPQPAVSVPAAGNGP